MVLPLDFVARHIAYCAHPKAGRVTPRQYRGGCGMKMRRLIAGGLVAGALMVGAAAPAAAADATYTPSSVTYGTPAVFKVTGLTPKGSYSLQIYSPAGAPLIPGGLPFTADASGAYSDPTLLPDQTDLPGTYLFEVTSSDGKLVARTTPTLVGTNTYYIVRRLGS